MKKLKENHPTYIKIQKVTDLMEELGLSLSSGLFGDYIITDAEQPDKFFPLVDIDSNNSVSEFPPQLEFKVYIESDK